MIFFHEGVAIKYKYGKIGEISKGPRPRLAERGEAARTGTLILDLATEERQVVVNKLEKRFGVKRILEDRGKDNVFPASFLYYFGVLTIAGELPNGKMIPKIQNWL